MAKQTYGNVVTRSVTMDTNLDGKEYYLVNLDTTDNRNVNLAGDATAFPFVLVDGGDGSSSKYEGAIAVGGVVEVKLGGTVAPGDKLTANASGLAIKTTTSGDHYGLIALEIGVANDVISALVSLGTV